MENATRVSLSDWDAAISQLSLKQCQAILYGLWHPKVTIDLAYGEILAYIAENRAKPTFGATLPESLKKAHYAGSVPQNVTNEAKKTQTLRQQY